MLRLWFLHTLLVVGPFAVAQPQLASAQQPLNRLSLMQQRTYYSLEEALVNPEKVYKLSLSNQKLKAFPLEVLLFKNLQVLNLSGNKIDSLPPEIGTLKNLQELNLAKNKLTKLPRSIGDLNHLEKLYLTSNNLYKFPNEMRGLQQLRYLDISFNRFLTFELNWVQRVLPKATIRY